MSVELVRSWLERLQEGDNALDMCDPEIEIRNWADSPAPGPFRGHEGVRRWWATVSDPDVVVEIRPFNLDEIIDLGEDRVLTIQRLTAKGRHSGIDIEQAWGSIIALREGKILSAVGYPSPEEARRAAGLEPG